MEHWRRKSQEDMESPDTLKLKKKARFIIIASITACIVMAVVEIIIVPHYAVKSMIKAVLFLGIPLVYNQMWKEKTLRRITKVTKESLQVATAVGLSIFVTLMVAYFIVGEFYDFSTISHGEEGEDPSGINPSNFIYVAIYISFVNSFIEEFFFRGFLYGTLESSTNKSAASKFSAMVFSLYHIALMVTWLPLEFVVLGLIALFIVGYVFNLLYEKYQNLYVTWFIHMFANFAINLITYFIYVLM